MKRYRITGTIDVDLLAASEEDAWGQLTEALDDFDFAWMPGSMAAEVVYPVPPGVGHWGPLLARTRVAETQRRTVCEWDGSWWWSNGHFALRVEGPCVPENGGGVQDIGRAIHPNLPRTQAEWVDGTGGDAKAYRSGRVGISREYRELVDDGAPGCTWWIGTANDPILAKDADGRIVAVVMPMAVSP